MANNSRAVQSQMLCDAALENDANVLRDLISKDPFLLGRSNTTTSSSPLHIACKHGCMEFVMELVSRSPTLCEELDSNNSSPLHIASQNGHSDLIRPLVEAKPTMCFSRDVQGMTPFHLAAMNGYLPVLKELLSLMPVAAKERVGGIGGDTILHLCVKYNRLDALNAIIDEVGEAEFLNATNEDGNSILHLAVANSRFEILEELLKEKRLEKSSLNSKGWTAMDIFTLSSKDPLKDDDNGELKDEKTDAPTEIKDDDDDDDDVCVKLKKAGAFPSRETMTDRLISRFENQRNALLVAASLIAAIAFQAGISPPAGVWQDTQINNSTTATPDNTTHIAGLSIMAQQSRVYFNQFLTVNTLCLVFAITSMGLLIVPVSPRIFPWVAVQMTMFSSLIYMLIAYSSAVYPMKYGQTDSKVGKFLLLQLPAVASSVTMGGYILYGGLKFRTMTAKHRSASKQVRSK